MRRLKAGGLGREEETEKEREGKDGHER